VLEHDVLVDEDDEPEPPQFDQPRVRAGVVLVVTRDEIRPVPRLEARERLGVRCKIATTSASSAFTDATMASR
jgi:hypothetical protein